MLRYAVQVMCIAEHTIEDAERQRVLKHAIELAERKGFFFFHFKSALTAFVPCTPTRGLTEGFLCGIVTKSK